MSKKPRSTVAPGLQAWVDARSRHRLSHAHVQMARELGMNPKKLGSIDNHDQEPWKAPLPQFIEQLYLKRFGRERPEVVVSLEQRARQIEEKKAARKAARAARRVEAASGDPPSRSARQTRGSAAQNQSPEVGVPPTISGAGDDQARV